MSIGLTNTLNLFIQDLIKLFFLKLVPKNNNFIVKDEHFHQFLGTAMGIIVASTYATLCNTSHGIPRNSVLRKK